MCGVHGGLNYSAHMEQKRRRGILHRKMKFQHFISAFWHFGEIISFVFDSLHTYSAGTATGPHSHELWGLRPCHYHAYVESFSYVFRIRSSSRARKVEKVSFEQKLAMNCDVS